MNPKTANTVLGMGIIFLTTFGVWAGIWALAQHTPWWIFAPLGMTITTVATTTIVGFRNARNQAPETPGPAPRKEPSP